MGTIGIPFTEEMHDVILKEARKRNMRPETLLKIWILERAKNEFEINRVEQRNDTIDVFSLPLKVGYILTA
ncbi:MAG: hypothetical protein ACRD38_05410, partial [Nitrososphaerales archaeon]